MSTRHPVVHGVGMFYLWYFMNVAQQYNNPNIRFFVGIDKEYSKRYNSAFVVCGKLRNSKKSRLMNRL